MYVVFNATVRKDQKIMVPRDSGHIGPQLRLHPLWDQFLTFFGAENDVNVVLRICMYVTIVSPLPGLTIIFRPPRPSGLG